MDFNHDERHYIRLEGDGSLCTLFRLLKEANVIPCSHHLGNVELCLAVFGIYGRRLQER